MRSGRKMMKLMVHTAFSAATASIAASSAQATLTPYFERGERIVEIPIPRGRPEVCVIPKHYPGANYSRTDLSTEETLCGINEYKNAAVCPKLNSTNPGINIASVPEGASISAIEARNCSKETGAKKLAKYKLSTSCSYTPSILGYYHVSRILGGLANVPPSVVRTFDLDRHLELGAKALSQVRSGDLIAQTWSGLISQLRAGASGRKKDQLLTDNLDQSYGALILSPKGDEFYKEFFNGGAQNIIRAQRFRDSNPIFALVKNSAPVEKLVGRDFNAANVQRMVQMRDAVDMVVLDTLLNQQDRFGNINYINKYYFFDRNDTKSDGTPKLKSSLKPTEGAVGVKEIMLQDNDCGVAKENIAKKAGLAGFIRHIDPGMYRRLQKLNNDSATAETKAFFRQNLLFTEGDYVGFRKNLAQLASDLKTACKNGSLKLDLDLQAHFSGGDRAAASCE